MDTRIYAITHKEFEKPEEEMYRILHAGRALGSDLGYEGDDTGDNISSKNKNYCELTGLYWIWKNVKCDIVGLCHYRRYFVRDEDFLHKDYVENVLKDFDIILPNSAETEYGSNREHYKNVHVESDMEICRDVLLKLYPDYVKAFDHFMDTNLASLANMIITKKEILDEYCQFLFDVLFEIEKRVDISDYDEYQARIFGFISERLLRIWVFMHEYRVKEEEVRIIDPKDANNAQKIVALRNRVVSLILKDLTESYKSGKPYDIVENVPLDVDLDGKIPVWICWWQGIETAPDIVRMCVDSIYKNIPKDKAKVHLITFDNVGQYIELPVWVVEKFDNGSITMTHLSDILRAGLLYRYGGMWIDATYYIARPLPDYIFEPDSFYTIRNHTIYWVADISQSRWSCNLFKAKPFDIMFRYMLNSFYQYWDFKDELIDYFLIDHVINIGYNEIPQIRETIENCCYSQPQVLTLMDRINEIYSEEAYKEITADTEIFKLSYKKPLYKETLLGKETIYGHLLKTHGIDF